MLISESPIAAIGNNEMYAGPLQCGNVVRNIDKKNITISSGILISLKTLTALLALELYFLEKKTAIIATVNGLFITN